MLHADAPQLAGEFLAENVAALVVTIAKGYSHILAPATSNGKNIMPRVAALLDVQQISEISRGGIAGYLRAADLRRQRTGHREVEGQADQGHHRAHHRF